MTRDQQLEAAYNQGYKAYGDGYSKNEYRHLDYRWEAWNFGYLDACRDDMEANSDG